MVIKEIIGTFLCSLMPLSFQNYRISEKVIKPAFLIGQRKVYMDKEIFVSSIPSWKIWLLSSEVRKIENNSWNFSLFKIHNFFPQVSKKYFQLYFINFLVRTLNVFKKILDYYLPTKSCSEKLKSTFCSLLPANATVQSTLVSSFCHPVISFCL